MAEILEDSLSSFLQKISSHESQPSFDIRKTKYPCQNGR